MSMIALSELCSFYYTAAVVMAGVLMIGVTSGMVGVFTMLRGQSMLADTISHAMLPGIVASCILSGSCTPLTAMAGAVATGCSALLIVWLLSRTTLLKKDAILGIVLSASFGAGLMLLTQMQKGLYGSKGALNSFLLGSCAMVLKTDLYYVGVVLLMVMVGMFAFWRTLKIVLFDQQTAYMMGVSVVTVDMVCMGLLLLVVAVGVQVVGVVLMSSMLIAPAAAARQLARSLEQMILIAVVVAASAGIVSVLLSRAIPHVPTGPVMVVTMSVAVLIACIYRMVRER